MSYTTSCHSLLNNVLRAKLLISCLATALLTGCANTPWVPSPQLATSDGPAILHVSEEVPINIFYLRNMNPPVRMFPGDYALIGENKRGRFYRSPRMMQNNTKRYSYDAPVGHLRVHRSLEQQEFGIIVPPSEYGSPNPAIHNIWIDITPEGASDPNRSVFEVPPFRASVRP